MSFGAAFAQNISPYISNLGEKVSEFAPEKRKRRQLELAKMAADTEGVQADVRTRKAGAQSAELAVGQQQKAAGLQGQVQSEVASFLESEQLDASPESAAKIAKFTLGLMSKYGQAAEQSGAVKTLQNRADTQYAQNVTEESSKRMAEFSDNISDENREQEQEFRRSERKAGEDFQREINNIRLEREEKLAELEQKSANTENVKFALDVKKQINSDASVKAWRDINEKAGSMNRLWSDYKKNGSKGSRVSLDQALITLYNKILDPTSVVRESEYARTETGQAKMEQLKGMYAKFKQGGTGLTDREREALIKSANLLWSASREGASAVIDDYRTTLSGTDVDFGRIVGDSLLKPFKGIPETVVTGEAFDSALDSAMGVFNKTGSGNTRGRRNSRDYDAIIDSVANEDF